MYYFDILKSKDPKSLKGFSSGVWRSNKAYKNGVYLSGRFPDIGRYLTQFYISLGLCYW